MENSTRVCGLKINAAQGKAEYCIGLETHARVLILYEYGDTLTGLKHFWSKNRLFWLLL